jgi:hypothetical protein
MKSSTRVYGPRVELHGRFERVIAYMVEVNAASLGRGAFTHDIQLFECEWPCPMHCTVTVPSARA